MDGKAAGPRSISRLLLEAGDVLFLALVSITATLSMHWVHRAGFNLAISVVAGMFIAMAIQMFLALAASSILGSRESMVPSMVIAMVSPMVVCIADMTGHHATWRGLMVVGLLLGAGAYPIARWCGCYRSRACRPAPAVAQGPHAAHPPNSEL